MNRKELIKICKLTQNGVKRYVRSKVKTMSRKGFIYHKGTLPILLVAHMDTVHEELPRRIRGRKIISSPQGIGGDDRCGIYAILEILKKYDCHAVFTEDEEVGCVGAGYFAKSKLAKRIRNKMLFAIEIDRKGNNDAVFYECDNEDFTEFVTKEYWQEDWGSFTDICEICPSINCAGVNLSSGYYNQHTKKETINLKELDTIISEIQKLIERGLKDNNRYEYVERECLYNFYRSKNYRTYTDDYFEDWNGYCYGGSCRDGEKQILKHYAVYDPDFREWVEVWGFDEYDALDNYIEYWNPNADFDDLSIQGVTKTGNFAYSEQHIDSIEIL